MLLKRLASVPPESLCKLHISTRMPLQGDSASETPRSADDLNCLSSQICHTALLEVQSFSSEVLQSDVTSMREIAEGRCAGQERLQLVVAAAWVDALADCAWLGLRVRG